jgi:hypothetical protein
MLYKLEACGQNVFANLCVQILLEAWAKLIKYSCSLQPRRENDMQEHDRDIFFTSTPGRLSFQTLEKRFLGQDKTCVLSLTPPPPPPPPPDTPQALGNRKAGKEAVGTRVGPKIGGSIGG